MGSQETEADLILFALSCCVQDFNSSFIEAAICKRLYKEIIFLTGFTEERVPFQLAENWMSQPDGILEAISLAVIPGLTLGILDNCDPFDKARYLLAGRWLWESYTKTNLSDLFADSPSGNDPIKQRTVEDLAAIAQNRAAQDLNIAPNMREEGGYKWKRKDAKPLLPEEIPKEWVVPKPTK